MMNSDDRTRYAEYKERLRSSELSTIPIESGDAIDLQMLNHIPKNHLGMQDMRGIGMNKNMIFNALLDGGIITQIDMNQGHHGTTLTVEIECVAPLSDAHPGLEYNMRNAPTPIQEEPRVGIRIIGGIRYEG